MAKQFACQDAGMDRPGNFTVETETELMQHVQVHAKSAHPDLQVTAEFAAADQEPDQDRLSPDPPIGRRRLGCAAR